MIIGDASFIDPSYWDLDKGNQCFYTGLPYSSLPDKHVSNFKSRTFMQKFERETFPDLNMRALEHPIEY